MIFDNKTYKLPDDNFVHALSLKKQIVIGNSFNHGMRHYIGWTHRFNGKYKKTAAFTISLDGTIYKHFDPNYCSEYFGNKDLDSKTIVILLENDGWLLKDDQKNSYITWIGDIYNKSGGIVEKRWRGFTYWSSYNEKQIESAVFLINELCAEFFIPKTILSHNTKVDNLKDYEGIIYKSNIDKQYTDLSPAWNCVEFKNKVEVNID